MDHSGNRKKDFGMDSVLFSALCEQFCDKKAEKRNRPVYTAWLGEKAYRHDAVSGKLHRLCHNDGGRHSSGRGAFQAFVPVIAQAEQCAA